MQKTIPSTISSLPEASSLVKSSLPEASSSTKTVAGPRSDRTQRRLTRLKNELNRIAEDQKDNKNDSGFNVWTLNEQLTEWEGVLLGPADTIYAKGKFPFRISIPEEYPCKAPIIYFTARIYHPNISEAYQMTNSLGMLEGIRSDICIDILKDQWSPALSITSILLSTRNLFNDPNFKDPLNMRAVDHYMSNKPDYEKAVKECVLLNTPI